MTKTELAELSDAELSVRYSRARTNPDEWGHPRVQTLRAEMQRRTEVRVPPAEQVG